jgi:glycosyltransferase involved in cell wall biosynthesis
MKPVIHIITTISMGGAEKQLLTLTSEQVQSGREVTVLYLKGIPELSDLFIKSGVKIVDQYSNRNIAIQWYFLRRFLRKNKAALVHAHLPRAELFGTLTPKEVSLFVSRHNAEPFFPGAPMFVSRILSRYVSRRATNVIAISEAVKQYLIDCNEVTDPNKIKVVLYGFNRSFRDENIPDPQIEMLKDKKTIIGTISRLVPQKDLGTLINAFHLFLNENPDAHLVIVGDGVMKEELSALTYKLGVESNVIWYGRTANVNSILREFDLFALTSLYEGFGLVLLEAMENCVPIVAARNSAIPEVLGDEYEGLFRTGDYKELAAKFGSSLEKNQNIRMRKYLAQRIEIFQPDRMRLEIDGIYEEQENL